MIPGIVASVRRAAGGGIPGDPHWDKVVSLLHFDGANGSTTFVDEKGKTWTAAGDAQITTTDPLIGSGSLLLDGAGDYVTGASHADFAFGTGDFTIECFMREAAGGVTHYLLSFGPGWIIYIGANDNIYFNTASTNQISGGTYSRGSRHHIELSRASGVVRLFYSGGLVGSWTDSGPTNIAAAPIELGRYAGDSNLRFSGLIDEVRITKGVARHTAAFTPPTEAFPSA